MRRFYYAGAVLSAVLIVALSRGAAGAADTAPASAEQARITEAVQAYASKLKADQEKAIDTMVANRATALLNDPATQFLGNPKGDVAIIEFFDYTCPFCKAAEPRIQQLLKDDKNVKLIVKEFPILRPQSLVASKAALASVKQGKYEKFHQAMMNLKGQLEEQTIFDIAKDVGLDVERLRKDMDAPEIADQIIANFNLARTLRIVETPTFIIGNHVVTEPSARMDFPKLVAAERAKNAAVTRP